MTAVKPGALFRASAATATYRQRFTPATAQLSWLSCGQHELPPGSCSGNFCLASEESLLFMWQGAATVRVDEHGYDLAPYDTLYVPRGRRFQILNPHADGAQLMQCSAPADHVHPAHHSRFAEYAQREERIRHLAGKEVFMMFDVSEAADRLIAGYTFFDAHQRSWPPRHHADQEEVYIFTKGHGAMAVYETQESLTFVTSVSAGDLVTIPVRNCHPVFTQESPLEHIWCTAGARTTIL